jgi:tripartite-type tricarboxylate transporter receptor subunit TctC
MLGVLLPQRSPAIPDIPTMTEAGMPRVSIPSWQAIVAPPETPHEVVNRMSRQVSIALSNPDVLTQFDQLWLMGGGSTPDLLASVIAQDLET